MSRQKDHIAAAELAAEQMIGGSSKGGFDLEPFLIGESLDVIQAAAADNTDPVI
jgi:hypothetical protein